jgi:O6-methylguanine-DNA--protein-cysteine methyltransferase
MDKTLPDKEKKFDPALTEEGYEKSRRGAWKDSPQGRLAIRLFSRGIMGAAFFTAGGLLNRRWMHTSEETLNEAEKLLEGKYDATKTFSEQKNPLQFIAKTIDVFVGKPIEFIVKIVTGNETLAKNSIRFRPTKFKDMEESLYKIARAAKNKETTTYRKVAKALGSPEARDACAKAIRRVRSMPLPLVHRGRSLGNETVAVTFDFFCASIGDAIGRDIADLFDSKVEKKWLKDGHVDFKQAAKSAAKSAFRYVTYNGGEDWAVAIPYVYFMKGQRSLINHFSPGFERDFDSNLNGGSFKIDEHKNIIGNYNIEGALDLQSRFTVYNMGTLAYRELYDFTARKLQGKNAVLYGAPDKDTSHETFGKKIGNVFKWLTRSVVKGGIYMTPATPFFWITRTPQTKHRGLFIYTDPNRKAWTLNYENPKVERLVEAGVVQHRKYENLYASELSEITNKETGVKTIGNTITNFTPETRTYFSRYNPDPKKDPGHQFEWRNKEWFEGKGNNPVSNFPFDAHKDTFNVVDKGLNAAGKANHELAKALDKPAAWMDKFSKDNPKIGGAFKKILSLKSTDDFKRFTHPFIYASASYTPYMYAKAEAAKLWDTGKMDYALERMIDGAAGLNWGEFKAGVSETTNAFLHHPFSDPKREEEANRRNKFDTSHSDSVNRDGNGNDHGRRGDLSWREFVVKGKPEDALELTANRNKSHAEKEELRQVLEKSTPPTNSIN